MKFTLVATATVFALAASASPIDVVKRFSSGKSYSCGNPTTCEKSGGQAYKSDSQYYCWCPSSSTHYYNDQCKSNPQPSSGGYSGHGGKGGHYKRQADFIIPSEADALRILSCSYELEACPLPSGDYECVDTASSLDACGSCNNDCLSIPNVESVSCFESQCIVYACEKGFSVVNNACVPETL